VGYGRNPAGSDTAIAADLGLGQSYVSKLHRIMGIKPQKVLKHWRESSAPLTVDQMLKVVSVAPELQQETYDNLLKAAEPTEAGKNDWLKGAEEKAKKLGTLLGDLQRAN
jgi:hypothetical protein